jgi:hypothetical protein
VLLVANITSWLMFSAGIVLLTLILLKRWYRYYGRRGRKATTDKPAVYDFARHESRPLDSPPELLRWQVEMHDTARDLKAELDSKMSVLQALVQIAREERQRLEAAIHRAHQLGLSTRRDTLDEIERLTSQLVAEGNVDHVNESVDSSAADATGTSQREPLFPTHRRTAIYDLSDHGHSPAAIAEQIGTPIGDVEMVLGTRGRGE